MRLTHGAIAIAMTALLAACSDPGDRVDPDASENKESAACLLLRAGEREDLVGSRVDFVEKADPLLAFESQCSWVSKKGGVRVVSIPADEWAKALPAAIAQLESSKQVTDAANKAEIAKAKKLIGENGALTAEQACEFFTTLAEIGGGEPGSHMMVQYTSGGDSLVVTAQTCTDGVFNSVSFGRKGLKKSVEAEERLTQALELVHGRALATG